MDLLHRLFRKKHTLTLKVTSPNGFHLRPVAKMVNRIREYDAVITFNAHGKVAKGMQLNEILSLGLNKDDWFTLTITAKDPQTIATELERYFNDLMNADEAMVDNSARARGENPYTSRILEATILSDSIACAPLYPYREELREADEHRPFGEALALALDALALESADTADRLRSEIAAVHRELLSEIASKLSAQTQMAFDQAIEEAKATLANTANASKIADYEDIRQRVLAHMGYRLEPVYPDTPFILLADDLLPSQVAPLTTSKAAGVILRRTSPAAHSAILLRNTRLPALICEGTIEADEAIVDGALGIIVPDPSEDDKALALKRSKEYRECAEAAFLHRHEEALTRSNRTIRILANIADLTSAKEAKEMGAEGVGLCRSEFIFTDHEPSLEEQTEAYGALFDLFDDFTIRTLDVGGDKGLSYIKLPHETNPFLGIRGIRLMWTHREIIAAQLEAILRAARNRPIKIMFPMIATTDEFLEAKELAQEIAARKNIAISNIRFGIMLELPSVIFALEEFDKIVDFYSIGTNDLTQYLFGIERTHPTLSVPVDAPILMNALAYIRAHAKKPLSICGELAGYADAVPQLIELGYDTLSISPALIPGIKEKIRNV